MSEELKDRALAFTHMFLILKWYRKEISDVTGDIIKEEAERIFECNPDRVNKVIFVRGVDKALKESGFLE